MNFYQQSELMLALSKHICHY